MIRSRRGLAALLVAALLGACATGDTDVTGAVPASAATAAAVRAPSVEVGPDAATGLLDADEAVLPAGALRLTLEQLLGEHVLLVSGAAADHAEGLPTDDALAVVADNTDRLTEAIALVYGDVGARAFQSLWSQHVAFFLDLARASADRDRVAVDEAMGHLHHYEEGFGSFTATATEGALPADVVAQLLAVHVADIDAYLEARRDDEPEDAAMILARGHDEAASIGAALAGAIAGQGPVAFPGDVEEARVEAAASLARAFAAHLAVRATGPDAGPYAAETAAARVETALQTTISDDREAIEAWRRLTTAGDGDEAGTIADAQTIADALGAGDRGQAVLRIALAPTGSPTDPDLLDAHRAAYDLASAWLG